MVCPSCGSEIKDGDKFCRKCGFAVQINQKITNEKNLKSKKRNIITVVCCLIFVLIVILAVAFFIYNQPQRKMSRAIAAGNFGEAYEIYNSSFDGKEMSEDTVSTLKNYIDGFLNKFENGETDYESSMEQMNELSGLVDANHDLYEYYSEALDKINMLRDFENYYLKASELENSKDYVNAVQYYQKCLELVPDSEKTKEGLSNTTEKYKNEILSQMQNLIAEKNYDDAENILSSALKYLPNDKDLTDALNSISEIEVENVIEEAYLAASNGDWDDALNILDESKNTYLSNKEIAEAYEDITSKMPITLENITTVSESNVAKYDTVVKDRWGNVYDGGVRIEGSTDGYALYALNKKFSKFTGTVFVVDTASAGKNLWFAIYLDDELAYYADEITEESQPILIELETTNCTTMRIVTGNEGSYSNGGLIFAETLFEKTKEDVGK